MITVVGDGGGGGGCGGGTYVGGGGVKVGVTVVVCGGGTRPGSDLSLDRRAIVGELDVRTTTVPDTRVVTPAVVGSAPEDAAVDRPMKKAAKNPAAAIRTPPSMRGSVTPV
jgi:hypothetical protein